MLRLVWGVCYLGERSIGRAGMSLSNGEADPTSKIQSGRDGAER